jgi:hypothetical protein
MLGITVINNLVAEAFSSKLSISAAEQRSTDCDVEMGKARNHLGVDDREIVLVSLHKLVQSTTFFANELLRIGVGA